MSVKIVVLLKKPVIVLVVIVLGEQDQVMVLATVALAPVVHQTGLNNQTIITRANGALILVAGEVRLIVKLLVVAVGLILLGRPGVTVQ